ncbi:predicted protein [Scheffersomyces stipitis CBS 6054]|uniref:Uncharacterized protein n=1 Tax=Scheffersomyces stipitis (strain ATCC 58785 / CBS 6054 / NBRC 10063 / NRRL Y-11545) TaxID=322104 RepID=A3LNH8_PICST|nr:predicted protein [Scheffersomyces stipitis CBS 6054]ABN64336.1 predicted protein [Scheffersomyces stipitis CBS 6054]
MSKSVKVKETSEVPDNWSEQLEEVAHEASRCNKILSSYPVEVVHSNEYAISDEPEPEESEEPEMPEDSGSGEFVFSEALRHLLQWNSTTSETTSLLPLYPISGSQIQRSYIESLLEIVWRYLATRAMRRFFRRYKTTVIIVSIVIATAVVVLLFYTSQWKNVVRFLQLVVCYFLEQYGQSPQFCQTS